MIGKMESCNCERSSKYVDALRVAAKREDISDHFSCSDGARDLSRD